MKSVDTIEEFIAEAGGGKRLVIYGAGWAGRIVSEFLKNNGIMAASFAVTEQDREWDLEGIRVRRIDDIVNDRGEEHITIVLAATDMHRSAMEDELKKRNVFSYIGLSDPLIYEMSGENRKSYARKAEADKKERKPEKTVGFPAPGYLDTNYAEQRLVIDKMEGVSYVAMPKETAEITWTDDVYKTDWERYRQLTEACYWPKEYLPEVELIHTFNMVCKTECPWCASFETTIPRVWPKTEREKEYYLQLVEYMKQPNCKVLYAFCRNAYKIQEHNLMRYVSSEDVDLLMAKTKVLHPPQKVLITDEEFEKKYKGDRIHFIFIGRAFFFKGGRELIRALSSFEDRYAFKLTLISGLLHNDYFTKVSYEEAVKWKKIILGKRWIDYYESMSNDAVLEKCKEATVGLLPSVADTYGYAVLEMQAAGCPVVTTNVRAFPEINNEECGWMCRIPVDDLGYCAEQKESVWSEILEKELVKCFQDIFEHPDKIKGKGAAALERIRAMHDPYAYQKELKSNLEAGSEVSVL